MITISIRIAGKERLAMEVQNETEAAAVASAIRYHMKALQRQGRVAVLARHEDGIDRIMFNGARRSHGPLPGAAC